MIRINLSAADCDKISDLCGKNGLTVAQLLESFIGDLIGGGSSGGSDEREYAKRWFERRGFGMFQQETLLSFLLNFRDAEEFCGLLEDIEMAKEDIEAYEKDPSGYNTEDTEEIQYIIDDLENWKKEYDELIREYAEKHPDADIEEEIKDVKEWYAEKERLRRE